MGSVGGPVGDSRTGRRQLIGVGLGCLLTMQQRIGNLINPVVVPAGRISARAQNGAVITAQGSAIDDDHLYPVQATESTWVEDQLTRVREPATQYRRERLTAHMRRPWHPGLDRAGRVFGTATG